MRRAVVWAIAVAVLVAFVAFAYIMNPGDVDFRVTSTLTYRLPLGILLVATLVVGILFAVLAVALQQLNHRLATWGQRRKARQVAETEELNASGVALAWGGEIERSRHVLKKAWRRDPGNAAAALALAASYSDTGEIETAKQVLGTAVGERPNDPELRLALGDVLHRKGETAEAIRMYETLRVQFPRSPRVLVALREIYAETDRWNDAVQIQDRYISELASAEGIQRERDRLRHFRFRAAMQIEDPEARIAALESILDEYRDYAPAAEAVGDAMLAAGRPDDAMKVWEKSFKRNPRMDLAGKMLAQQTTSNGRHRIVALVNKHADALDDDQVHVFRARAAMQNDSLDTAREELEAVGNSADPAVQRCWADLHQKRGDAERAWQTLRPLASR
jgi:tetratricopeptide (TPR) repeat protein